jgi:hypothetical protein
VTAALQLVGRALRDQFPLSSTAIRSPTSVAGEQAVHRGETDR